MKCMYACHALTGQFQIDEIWCSGYNPILNNNDDSRRQHQNNDPQFIQCDRSGEIERYPNRFIIASQFLHEDSEEISQHFISKMVRNMSNFGLVSRAS